MYFAMDGSCAVVINMRIEETATDANGDHVIPQPATQIVSQTRLGTLDLAIAESHDRVMVLRIP